MTLRPEKDPIGHALHDYLNTSISENIQVFSDIADEDVIPTSYLFRNYRQMPLLEKKGLQLCKGTILDIGAAAGSHSLYLQEKNMNVTAVEISTLCCEVMYKRGIVNIINQNYFELDTQQVDTLLFMMNGIGIAGTIAGLKKFFLKANQLLKSGGEIIFDSSDIEYLYLNDDGSTSINLNALYYGELNYTLKYRDITGEPFPWLFIDFLTLATVAKNFGFTAKLIHQGKHFDYLGILQKN